MFVQARNKSCLSNNSVFKLLRITASIAKNLRILKQRKSEKITINIENENRMQIFPEHVAIIFIN